jgi:hypothetical protein
MHCAGLGIVRAIHQTADSGMNRRSRAHRTRLNCSKQFAAAQAVVTDVHSRIPQCHNFSMSGGIVVSQVSIPPSPHHQSVTHDDGAYRHFSRFERPLGAA